MAHWTQDKSGPTLQRAPPAIPAQQEPQPPLRMRKPQPAGLPQASDYDTDAGARHAGSAAGVNQLHT